jgi:uncharacterized protein (DUF2344 family)
VEQQYKFLKEQNERIESMYSDYNDLLEYKQVLEASQVMLDTEEFREMRHRLSSSFSESSHFNGYESEEAKRLIEVPEPSEMESEHHSDEKDEVTVGRVVGTCHNDDVLRLERLMFRATRGNALVVTRNTGGIKTFDKKVIPRSVFVVIFQEGEQLRAKIENIAKSFSKNKYVLPKSNLRSKIEKLKDRIEQTRQLIVMSIVGIEKYLTSCNKDCNIDLYKRICLHDSAVYQRLDYLHFNNNVFHGFFWS